MSVTNYIDILFNGKKIKVEVSMNIIQVEQDDEEDTEIEHQESNIYFEFNSKELEGLYKFGYFISVDGIHDLSLKEVSFTLFNFSMKIFI